MKMTVQCDSHNERSNEMDGTNTLGDSAVVQKPIICEMPAGDVLQSIEGAKTGPDAFECVRHYDRIKEHYDRIRGKSLSACGEKVTLGGWYDRLNCEVFHALAYGDKAQAVEELYDCIAVCLRTIDLIEGRQPLGKPNGMTIATFSASKPSETR